MAEKKKDELTSPLLRVSENTAQKLAQYQAGYQEGEKVQNAYNEYTNLKQNAPQAYSSPYQAQLDDLYNKIVNRQPFQYDMNGDMLYQNAKEQYQQLGKQAMVDTMGQAAQLTGGYGNSYAQNVGNQAYQQYLLKLNEQLPTYYNLAMQRYNMEGDALNNQYGLLNDRENEAYGRYRDTVSDYNQNLQMAYNVYNNERDTDYGQYRDALGYWQDQAGAENKDYWTQTQFEYQKEQDALDRAFAEKQLQQEMAYKYAALAQSRANAAAKQKEEEEAAKAKSQLTDAQKTIQDIMNTRFVSGTGLGLNSLGIGVRSSAEDAINAQENKAETQKRETLLDVARNNSTMKAPMADRADSSLKKFDLGAINGKTTAENVETLTKKLQNQYVMGSAVGAKGKYYNNAQGFLEDSADTLAYYVQSGFISEAEATKTMQNLAKQFGVN